MMLTPLTDAETTAKSATVLLTALAALWAIVRFVLRPLFDDSVFNAWKRKSPDVESHMRLTMFKDDIAQRAELREDVAKALQLSMACTAQLAAVGEQVAAASTLLHSISGLAQRIEGVDDRLGEMVKQIDRANTSAENNGRILAAHSAILGERRQQARRTGDPLPPDGASDGGDGSDGLHFIPPTP